MIKKNIYLLRIVYICTKVKFYIIFNIFAIDLIRHEYCTIHIHRLLGLGLGLGLGLFIRKKKKVIIPGEQRLF